MCTHEAQKVNFYASTASSSSVMLEQARLDTLVTLDTFVSIRSTRNLVCCVVCIKLLCVSY